MKRNDIGDSYVLGCSSGSLRRGECIHQKDDHLCWQALCATVTGQPVRRTKSYAGTPTIGNARSLWFPFHSPGAMGGESVWRRASTASPVQGRLNFRRTAGSGSLRNTASALVAISSATLSSRCDQCDYCRSLLPDEPARVRQTSNLCAAISI